MSDIETGQVVTAAARVYESFFVPALFAQWTEEVLDAASVGPGQAVLDVGCGTGVLARAARRRVGGGGRVVGLDPNAGMLEVARGAAPDIDWRSGTAEELPLERGEFDSVVSQFGLMFFADKARALNEMARVTRPGGRVAIAVWSTLEDNPGYRALAALVGRLFGPTAALALEAPFSLGDRDQFVSLLRSAVPEPTAEVRAGSARFESLESWLRTEIKGWTLADLIDDEQFLALERAAGNELAAFVEPSGEVEFEVRALVGAGTVGAA